MSFVSTAFLLALPLVAVPVLIHLYRGRQRDVIPWGAMQFLASAVTKGRSMERFEEFLLMVLRALAVAALIFAVARPMVRSSLLGLGADQEVILVLDNSLSMSRDIDGQTPGGRMKEEALKIVESLASSDAVQVMTAVGGEWATSEGIAADGRGKRQLREIIEATEPTLGAGDLLSSLQSAIHMSSASGSTARRIIVFTDSQASGWRIKEAATWKQLAAARDAAEFPIAIEVKDCGRRGVEVDNLAVTEISAPRFLVRPNEPIELTAQITNTGDVASGETVAEWLVADKVVAESPVGPLARHEQSPAVATLRLDKIGVFQVSCRLKARDQVPLDQTSGLVIEVADRIPVLFVYAEEVAQSVTARELFAAALGYRDGESRDWHSVFYPDVISPDELSEKTLGNYRAVVISGAADLDRAAFERLTEYVRAGGGLWLALGEGIDRNEFNRDWYSDGDGLSPLPLETLEIHQNTEAIAATIHPPARDHAATMQLSNTTQLDIDEARIRQRWQFGARPASSEAVSALLESGNGQPLVVENYVGQGRVIVQSFPLGLEWSNLPLLKAYVVMVQDWLNYVTAPTTARYNLAPGTSIVAIPPEDAPDASAEVLTSRGVEIALAATESDIGRAFRYSQTSVPGAYTVRFRDGDKLVSETPFYVSRDATESYLEPLGDTERRDVLRAAGLQFDGEGSSFRGGTEVARRREPIWGVLLVALVALIAGELLLANRLARQRHGFAVNMV